MFREHDPRRKIIYLTLVLTFFTAYIATACGGSGGSKTPEPCMPAQDVATAVQAGNNSAATFVARNQPQFATQLVRAMTVFPPKPCNPFEALGTQAAGTATKFAVKKQTAEAQEFFLTAHVQMTQAAQTLAPQPNVTPTR